MVEACLEVLCLVVRAHHPMEWGGIQAAVSATAQEMVENWKILGNIKPRLLLQLLGASVLDNVLLFFAHLTENTGDVEPSDENKVEVQ